MEEVIEVGVGEFGQALEALSPLARLFIGVSLAAWASRVAEREQERVYWALVTQDWT